MLLLGILCLTLCFVVSQVKSKVEEFKEHMPLIQTLFNPGLRERHWEQISDIVGFPIKQDDETTLSKFVDMNLDQYIPKFEGQYHCYWHC